MVTDPTEVEVVYAYTVAATPVDVTEIDDTPDATETGARVVLSAETSFTPDATKLITVAVSAVAASATVFDESITFDTGTATVTGATVVVVLLAPATVTANGAACAEVEMPTIASAAAVARAIFFVTFIVFLFFI